MTHIDRVQSDNQVQATKSCLACVRSGLELQRVARELEAARAELERWKLAASDERRTAVAYLLTYANHYNRESASSKALFEASVGIARGLHFDDKRDGELEAVRHEVAAMSRSPRCDAPVRRTASSSRCAGRQ